MLENYKQYSMKESAKNR